MSYNSNTYSDIQLTRQVKIAILYEPWKDNLVKSMQSSENINSQTRMS